MPNTPEKLMPKITHVRECFRITNFTVLFSGSEYFSILQNAEAPEMKDSQELELKINKHPKSRFIKVKSKSENVH